MPRIRVDDVFEALHCFFLFLSAAMYKAMPRFPSQPRFVKTRWTTCTSAIEPPLPTFKYNEREYAVKSVSISPETLCYETFPCFPSAQVHMTRSGAFCKCPTDYWCMTSCKVCFMRSRNTRFQLSWLCRPVVGGLHSSRTLEDPVLKKESVVIFSSME